MGMSIDEAITWLNTDDYESKGFADATSVAINTMRKYQKIQEIFDRYDKGELTHNMFGLLVGEVIEDGKID